MSDYNEISITAIMPTTFKRGENVLFLSVLATYEKILKRYYDFWTVFANITDPVNVDAELIDWLATETANPWRNLWDIDWSLATKRLLLRDTQVIFSKRLFPETLTLLFADFFLLSKLRPRSGFILGTTNPPASLLPATLGTSILDYEVVIPKSYFMGSAEYNLTKFIADNFGIPGNIPIVYET